ncbi:zinc-ribbon domain-containing protein [Rhodomicrobium vannielii ATCC 17100]|uniref:zinc-ribbon domain-containing protein n=1 Tax=Rhodomicrobium vannielii TaxID=1069 RepID=UPI001918C964|nr:zinc-ribbon domain-containing protein [Rhodomicrobium vannielii]MBJ7535424.1 zinc-ribbon domain-containing protein [Rhodomicrobium vannielii ATCC 17100]
MIIECPACTTRYDIKATLPPEGRSVRCAKCGTVWRALPDAVAEPQEFQDAGTQRVAEEEPSVPEVERQKRDLAAELRRQWAAEAAPRPEREEVAPGAHADADIAAAVQQHLPDEAAQDETVPETRYASFGEGWRRDDADLPDEPDVRADAEAQPVAGVAPSLDDERDAPEVAQHGPQAAEDPAENVPAEEAVSSAEPPAPDAEDVSGQDAPPEDGKVSWFGSFRRRHKQKDAEASTFAKEAAASPQVAETIPFPRQPIVAEAEAAGPAEPDLRTLEEARAAVRGVFSSLGDGRPSLAGHSFASPMTAPVSGAARDSDLSASGKDAGAPATQGLGEWREGKYDRNAWRAPEDERREESAGAADAGDADSAVPRWTPAQERSVASGDPEAALRKAMQSQFSEASDDKELAEELESHLRAAAGPRDEARAEDDLQGDLAAIWKRPQVRAPIAPAEDAYPAAEEAEEASFDPRLVREIEETQESSGVVRRGFGSLAVAAAWGLFVTVAAGLVVGLFAFRDIVADSAPGLAPLYTAFGMPVTVQPLSFDAVTYKWTLTDGKPTLLVSGAIYNTSKRKVKMPDFTITIKDRDPALDREYSAALRSGTTKIRSRQREDFDIELVSPSPTLSSIELALKKVR